MWVTFTAGGTLTWLAFFPGKKRKLQFYTKIKKKILGMDYVFYVYISYIYNLIYFSRVKEVFHNAPILLCNLSLGISSMIIWAMKGI